MPATSRAEIPVQTAAVPIASEGPFNANAAAARSGPLTMPVSSATRELRVSEINLRGSSSIVGRSE